MRLATVRATAEAGKAGVTWRVPTTARFGHVAVGGRKTALSATSGASHAFILAGRGCGAANRTRQVGPSDYFVRISLPCRVSRST